MSMRAFIVLNTDYWQDAKESPEAFVQALSTLINRGRSTRKGAFGILYGAVGDPDLTHTITVGRGGIKRTYESFGQVFDADTGEEVKVE